MGRLYDRFCSGLLAYAINLTASPTKGLAFLCSLLFPHESGEKKRKQYVCVSHEPPKACFIENDSNHFQETKTSSGYTMVELLLALVVGSVVIAGAYTSYSLVASTQANYASRTELQEVGVPALRLMERHIRMAGHESLDSELDPVYGDITEPATLTDSGNACCDTLTLEYDDTLGTRYRVTYRTDLRANPTRAALFMDREIWDGTSWNNDVSGALVADYVEDFQAEVAETVGDGRAKLVDIALTLRSKNALKQQQTFVKADYDPGNYVLSTNDHYYRETFATSVMLRNVR